MDELMIGKDKSGYKLYLSENGSLHWTDPEGNPLDDFTMNHVNKRTIKDWIKEGFELIV